jgi:hypothetical protein
MKITPAQRSMLQFMLDAEKDGMTTLRPVHKANLQTHDALVRKGLVHEHEPDEHGFVNTTMTEEGRRRINAG